MLKKLIISCYFIIPIALIGQIRDTTLVEIDSLTGVKRIVNYNMNGTGGGWTGSAPRLTKRTITKYDINGNLIYLSRKTNKLNGCIGSTLYHRIMFADTVNGGWHTLTMRSRGYKHVYRNAQNKRIRQPKDKTEYRYLLDPDDRS